jgi:hypothetical protein
MHTHQRILTEETAPSGARLAYSQAYCRRLAGRALAAISDRGGFVVVSGAPLRGRRLLLQALAEAAAAAKFQVVQIPYPAGADPAGLFGARRVATIVDGAAPLFVVDDAGRPSTGELREICEAAPLSREWAAMLSVRAVLITRFAVTELDFLEPRIVGAFPFDETECDEAQPAAIVRLALVRPTTGPLSAPARNGALGGRSAPPARAAEPPAAGSARRRSSPRDIRAYAMAAYIAAIGALMGCYLAQAVGHRDRWPWASLAGTAASPLRDLLKPAGNGDPQR